MPSTERMKAKVCLVGDAAVGKTSLIRRFVSDTFSDIYQTTLSAKVVSKDVAVTVDGDAVDVKMQVWDVIGDTGVLDAIAASYFDGVQGIVAVCDLTRYSSFLHLPEWLGAIRRVAGEVPTALAVNKTDMQGEAFVMYDEYQVRAFAQEQGARWYFASAKTGLNVEAMFARLAADIVRAQRERASAPSAAA